MKVRIVNKVHPVYIIDPQARRRDKEGNEDDAMKPASVPKSSLHKDTRGQEAGKNGNKENSFVHFFIS